MQYGAYYTAQVERKECWFLVAVLRSFEHLAFDRTYDKTTSVFEFFVPEGQEKTFLELMNYFQGQAIVSNLTKHENRLVYEEI